MNLYYSGSVSYGEKGTFVGRKAMDVLRILSNKINDGYFSQISHSASECVTYSSADGFKVSIHSESLINPSLHAHNDIIYSWYEIYPRDGQWHAYIEEASIDSGYSFTKQITSASVNGSTDAFESWYAFNKLKYF